MFSLLWSEHCAYKHSKKLLRTLPTEGPRSSWGRARTPAPSTSATAGRSPSRSSRTTTRARSSRSRARPPASAGSCATSSRSARGRSRCSTRCASASRTPSARATCSTARWPGIGHYGNSIGVPTVGGEVYFEAPYETNCLVNAMAHRPGADRRHGPQRGGRRRQRPGAVRRLDRPRRHRRRVGARLRRARRRGRDQAPVGPGRRPVRGVQAPGVLAGAAGLRAAGGLAGPRRRGPDVAPPPRWRPRARSASTSTSPRSRCARPTWSRSRSWSPSRRSGCSASARRRTSTRCWRSARSGRSTARRSAP